LLTSIADYEEIAQLDSVEDQSERPDDRQINYQQTSINDIDVYALYLQHRTKIPETTALFDLSKAVFLKKLSD